MTATETVAARIRTPSPVLGLRNRRGSIRPLEITHAGSICVARRNNCMPPGCTKWQITWSEWQTVGQCRLDPTLAPKGVRWGRVTESEMDKMRRECRRSGRVLGSPVDRDRLLRGYGGDRTIRLVATFGETRNVPRVGRCRLLSAPTQKAFDAN
jgi:hypothetical protein